MGRSNLRPAPLELELRAELQEPSLQDIGRRLPRRSERVVLRQNRTRVQQVENVERRLDAPAARQAEALAEPDVHLRDALAVQRAGRNELRRRRGRAERATEILDLRGKDRVARRDLRTR